MGNPGRKGRQEKAVGVERHGSAKLAVVRRVSQIFFFALFMFLLVKSEFRGSLKGATGAQIPYPINWFHRKCSNLYKRACFPMCQ
jgi:hypothetical protein